MAGSLKLNDTDLKSVMITLAISAAGVLYYKWKKGSSGTGSLNPFNAAANTSSAASGSAGAIAPSSSINTYNVFPTVSSQQGTPNSFFNGGHGNVSPTLTNGAGATASVSKGQALSMPVKS
jgi:hypothetical protein